LRPRYSSSAKLSGVAAFVTALAPVFETVLAELRAGRKRSHWMWFVLPQLVVSESPRRLGFTPSAPAMKRARIWPTRCWGQTRSLHRDRACEREPIPSCDFRLARRYEVPVMCDAVLARHGGPGRCVSSSSRSLVPRAARRINAGAQSMLANEARGALYLMLQNRIYRGEIRAIRIAFDGRKGRAPARARRPLRQLAGSKHSTADRLPNSQVIVPALGRDRSRPLIQQSKTWSRTICRRHLIETMALPFAPHPWRRLTRYLRSSTLAAQLGVSPEDAEWQDFAPDSPRGNARSRPSR
jgi:hypothetical protein